MKQTEPFMYAEKVTELETIVAELEQGVDDLDKALALHAKGKQLADELQQYLEKAKTTIHKHLASEHDA